MRVRSSSRGKARRVPLFDKLVTNQGPPVFLSETMKEDAVHRSESAAHRAFLGDPIATHSKHVEFTVLRE